MKIGDLAQATGVTTDTLRYYERIGLLPPAHRTAAGYREYQPGVELRVRVIRNAVQLGFPLQEIANVLRVRDAGGAPCRQVRDYARKIVGEIDQRVVELRAQRRAMQKMIAQWDARLAATPPGKTAHLLETAVPTTRPRGKLARLRAKA